MKTVLYQAMAYDVIIRTRAKNSNGKQFRNACQHKSFQKNTSKHSTFFSMAFILRFFACQSSNTHKHKGHAHPKYPVQEGECIGCYGSGALVTIHEHRGPYCAECFRNDVKCRLGEAGTRANLEKCPHPGCEKPLTLTDLATIAAPPLIVNKFKNFTTKDKAGWVACPMCGETRELTESEQANKPAKLTCTHCTKDFCAQCSVPWHESLSCDAHREKESKKNEAESAELLQTARLRGWRRCPECRIFIEKNAGCNHMQHPICKTHFCYECGVQLLADGSHEFHKPDTYHFTNDGCRNLGFNIRQNDEYY